MTHVFSSCWLVRICWVVFWLAAVVPRTLAFERPNILLILADDLGIETHGCYGGTSYRTPHLDRLAEQGVRFTHAYAQPLCTPTRVQLMTGKYNHRNWRSFGILDPEARTLGHMLREAGYETAIFGKWQLQSYDPPDLPGASHRRGTGLHPQHAGFDEYALFHALHTEDKGSRYANPTMLESTLEGVPQLKTYPGAYGPDIWAERVIEFLERDSERPKFVYYPMALPHWPFEPTPESADWNPQQVPEANVKYAKDMIEKMDALVGRIADRVFAENGKRETVLIFYGDNGTDTRVFSSLQDGSVIQGGKATPRQSGIRVPLLVACPGRIQPRLESAIIDASDFVPTLMDLAGTEMHPEDRGDGVSFARFLSGRQQSWSQSLTGEERSERKTAFFWYDPRPGWDKERFRRSVFAVNHRYKLFRDGRLFRLDALSPGETPVHLNDRTEEDQRAAEQLAQVLADELTGVMEPPHVDAYGQPQPELAGQLNPREDTSGQAKELLAHGRELVYGRSDIPEHRLWVFPPQDLRPGELRPGVVFFHGGGWGGSPSSLAGQCIYLQQRGWNAVSVHFRAPRGGLTPEDTLRDARRAYRWILAHGHEFGIDASRLVVSGGSAGGHLALSLATIALPDDPVVDPPCGYVLFNPVIDLVDGWPAGRKRLAAAGIDARSFSPAHQVKPGLPPTLILSGAEDDLITPLQLARFQARMRANANACRLRIYPGATHAFFNYGRHENKYFYDTMQQCEEFLQERF